MRSTRLLFAALIGLFFTVRANAQELNLGERVQPLPSANRFSVPGYHVWCGAPVKGPDGRYHLFYSRWPVEVGFAPGWALRSEIAYAVSDKPTGPYQHVNVALPPRGINPATGNKFWDADVTHNANVFFNNGKFYLYYTGQYGDGKNYPMHRNHQRVGVAIADKPEGPWTRFDKPIVDITDDQTSFDSLCVTNPAACIRPDGGVVLVYKAVQHIEGKEMGGNVRYGVALAEKPEGPYVKTPGHIFEAKSAEADKHWMVAEDPFIWFSVKYGRKYFAVARDVVGTFTGASGGICMFESQDGLDWKPSQNPKVLGSRFQLADGSLSEKNIERPALLIENDEPLFLFGATDGYLKNKASSNVQIPLKPVAPINMGVMKGRITLEGANPKLPKIRVPTPSSPRLNLRATDEDRKKYEASFVEIDDQSLQVDAERGLANAFVYLAKAPSNWQSPKVDLKPLALTMQDYRFEPRAAIVRTGQDVLLKNSGVMADSFGFQPMNNGAQNRLVNAKTEITLAHPFTSPERIPIQAESQTNIWKMTFLLPLDHPFAAVTDTQGSFSIDGLPPGEHSFFIWHERAGWLEKSLIVKIQPSQSTEVNRSYSVDRLSKSR